MTTMLSSQFLMEILFVLLYRQSKSKMHYSVNNGIPLVYHLYFEVYNTDNTSTSMYVYWDMMMYLCIYLVLLSAKQLAL